VCYHVYAALAGTTVAGPRIVTAQGCCWRHEGARVEPLARGWAFTMREIVCIGSEEDCASFRDRGVRLAHRLADELGVDGVLAEAEDPFFAPTARGRALLQRLRALKHELRLFVGDGETVAAASFNLHERHFGEAFDIRLPGGEPAHTACVAFGLERWLLATLLRAPGAPVPARHDYQESVGS
jgi:seryl-tRNA synthetase